MPGAHAMRRGGGRDKIARLGVAGAVVVVACAAIPASNAVADVACLPVVAEAGSGVTGASRDGRFVTEPKLRPPRIEVTTPARGTAPGAILLTPFPQPDRSNQSGPLIVDDRGNPTWFAPNAEGMTALDLKVQTYRGEPVLTWWRGAVGTQGHGDGEMVIMDRSYRVVTTVEMGNGFTTDGHDLVITERDTALLMAYHEVPMDLRPFGGPEDGAVQEAVVQEVDIASGRVLFEWHSLDEVSPDESYVAAPGDVAWDYFHINSVAEDTDGGLLISARNTHAVYRLDRGTATVDWRLGGKRSDFDLGDGASFEWQHDAVHLPDGTVTIFDNGEGKRKDRSRAIALRLDEDAGTARVVRELPRTKAVRSETMGNYQSLAGGRAFVGWGSGAGYTEYRADDSVALDADLADGMRSYRAFRQEWRGQPAARPKVAGLAGRDGATDVYVSWNGATEVAAWRVLTGRDMAGLAPAVVHDREGFETKIDLPAGVDPGYVAVEAVNGEGEAIGCSAAHPVADRGRT